MPTWLATHFKINPQTDFVQSKSQLKVERNPWANFAYNTNQSWTLGQLKLQHEPMSTHFAHSYQWSRLSNRPHQQRGKIHASITSNNFSFSTQSNHCEIWKTRPIFPEPYMPWLMRTWSDKTDQFFPKPTSSTRAHTLRLQMTNLKTSRENAYGF